MVVHSTTGSRDCLIALSLVATVAACSASPEVVENQPLGASFGNYWHWPKNWTDTDDDGLPDAMIDAEGHLQPFPK